MGTWAVKVYGEMAVAKYARKHAASRKPLQRFLEIARAAQWPHFPAVEQTFAAADAPSTGTLIFDIAETNTASWRARTSKRKCFTSRAS